VAILNTVTGAAAAYSLRLINSSYTGKCIRARRSSDNAEQDIAFDTNGDLSTSSKIEDGSTSFSSWYGSDSVYVKTWYDQSVTNTYNAGQSTAGNQPRIVNAGTLDVDANGKAIVRFLAANSNYMTASTGGNLSQPNTISLVFKCNNNNVAYTYIDSTNSSYRHKFATEATGALVLYTNSTYGTASSVSNTNHNIYNVKFNGASSKIIRNGTEISGTNTCGTTEMNGITLGARQSLAEYLEGFEQEIILYNSALSDTDRRLLETDQGDYYGITVANALRTKTITATTSVSGTSPRSITKTISALVSTLGSMVREFIAGGGGSTTNKEITASVAASGPIVRSTTKIISITTSVSSSIARSISKSILAIVGAYGTTIRSINKTISAYASASVIISRAITKAITALSSSIGSVIRIRYGSIGTAKIVFKTKSRIKTFYTKSRAKTFYTKSRVKTFYTKKRGG
jgi:hypothetical protein